MPLTHAAGQTDRPPLNGLLQAAPHVSFVRSGGQLILMDLKHGKHRALNDVGARVWELLATPTTLGQIVLAIGAEYELPPDVPSDQALKDITALLDAFVAAGLVQTVSGEQ